MAVSSAIHTPSRGFWASGFQAAMRSIDGIGEGAQIAVR
jgi:hypothetical protein